MSTNLTLAELPYYNVFAIEYLIWYNNTAYFVTSVGGRSPTNTTPIVRLIGMVDTGNGSIITTLGCRVEGTLFKLNEAPSYHVHTSVSYVPAATAQVTRIFGLL